MESPLRIMTPNSIGPDITIRTTTLCNNSCPECSARPWMLNNPNYHTSLDDIRGFIFHTVESGYFFNQILLSGGEPTLWVNLMEASRLLADSKQRITASFKMYTNGSIIESSGTGIIDELLRYIDFIYVTNYGPRNSRARDMVSSKYRDGRVVVINNNLHFVRPRSPVDSSLPADCGCDAFCLFNGSIDLCSPPRTIMYDMGKVPEDFPYFSETLGHRYLDRLLTVDKFNQEFCRYCTANRKVSSKLRLVHADSGEPA